MHRAACAVFSIILLSAGCGYVGPVLPPSPGIPETITDLKAVERGDQIVVSFTTPPRTTDGVAITKFSEIDLRVGGEQQTPEARKAYAVEPPSPSEKEDPQAKAVNYAIPVSEWTGQHVAITVRTAMRKEGHFSAWSKPVILEVIPPLAQPKVEAKPSAGGIVLTWAASDDAQYLVERQAPADKQPVDLATVNESRYVDVSSQFDTEYRYVVIAKKGSAESLASEPVTITAPDVYPPATPTGLTAVAGPDGVDLAWQRNTEPDLQGYYVSRSVDGGAFARLGGLVALPTYVDTAAEHGKKYGYRVSAVDKKGNLSGECASVEVEY